MRIKDKKFFLYSLPFIALLLSYLLTWGPLGFLELKSIDLRFRWRGKLKAHPEIVVVKIDEVTLKQITEPVIFWNPYLARVIEALAEGGARVVAVDLLQRQSYHHLLPRHEEALVRALLLVRDKTPVLLASEISPLENSKGYRITEPIPAFRIFTEAGFINLTLDRDGSIRRQELLAPMLATPSGREASFYPSFPLMAAALYRQETPQLKQGNLYLGKETIPVDERHRMYINFVGPEGSYPFFSFVEVLSRAQRGESEYFRKNFQGKIVFLGVVAAELEEKRITPLSRDGGGIQPLTGVEIHAQSVDTILSRRFLKSPPPWLALMAALILAAAAVLICGRLKYWRGLLLVVLLGAVYAGMNFYLFKNYYLLPLALPLQSLLYATVAVNGYQYVLERRDRKILEASFAAYVNEEVMKQILKDPRLASTHGARRRVTILFSDLRSFTSRTEKKDPAEVVVFLNQYLSAMTEIIIGQGGTLDKFMGDGILCFFGAPLELPRHGAPQALQAALGMEKKLLELNAEWGYTEKDYVRMGVGIHTGEVIVGNIGSAKKMDYTIIGDAVNLASRLEGKTKDYPYAILISEETYETAGRPAPARYVDEIVVKGREGKVKIYGLGWPKG